MFCPKCGQPQLNDAVRFCSRCGFPLAGVADLLARDGVPAHGSGPVGPQPLSPRGRGIRQGGAIMLVGLFLTPMIAMLHPLAHLPGEYSLLGVMVFMAGLLRLLGAIIFESGAATAQGATTYVPPPAQAVFGPRANAQPLPPGDFRPAQADFPRRPDTAEIVHPPASVTDHTTRLLAERDDAAGR